MHVDFYFDYLSPYSYLAWKAARPRFGRNSWSLKPVFLPSVVTAFQDKGPAEIPVKRRYLLKDCLRKAELMGVPFRAPARLPFNSVPWLRLSARPQITEEQILLVDALYDAAWGMGLDMENTELVGEYLASKGLPIKEDSGARALVKKSMAEAREREIFGLPSFYANGELFWGHESLPLLDRYLEGLDPLPRQNFQDFVTQHGF